MESRSAPVNHKLNKGSVKLNSLGIIAAGGNGGANSLTTVNSKGGMVLENLKPEK